MDLQQWKGSAEARCIAEAKLPTANLFLHLSERAWQGYDNGLRIEQASLARANQKATEV